MHGATMLEGLRAADLDAAAAESHIPSLGDGEWAAEDDGTGYGDHVAEAYAATAPAYDVFSQTFPRSFPSSKPQQPTQPSVVVPHESEIRATCVLQVVDAITMPRALSVAHMGQIYVARRFVFHPPSMPVFSSPHEEVAVDGRTAALHIIERLATWAACNVDMASVCAVHIFSCDPLLTAAPGALANKFQSVHIFDSMPDVHPVPTVAPAPAAPPVPARQHSYLNPTAVPYAGVTATPAAYAMSPLSAATAGSSYAMSPMSAATAPVYAVAMSPMSGPAAPTYAGAHTQPAMSPVHHAAATPTNAATYAGAHAQPAVSPVAHVAATPTHAGASTTPGARPSMSPIAGAAPVAGLVVPPLSTPPILVVAA